MERVSKLEGGGSNRRWAGAGFVLVILLQSLGCASRPPLGPDDGGDGRSGRADAPIARDWLPADLPRGDASVHIGWATAAHAPGGAGWSTATGVAVDKYGNSYVTGWFEGTVIFGSTTLTTKPNYLAMFVSKLDPWGRFLWTVTPTRPKDEVVSVSEGVALDSEGNCYVTGYFTNRLAFGPSTLTGKGLYVTKLTPSGTFVWAVEPGGTGAGMSGDLAVDSLGNSYVTGKYWGTVVFGPSTLSTPASYVEELFLAKVSPSGTFLWASAMKGNGYNAAPFPTNGGLGIDLDASGGIYLAGALSNTAVFGSKTVSSVKGNYECAYAAKADPTGSFLWAFYPGGGDKGDWSQGYSVAVDSSGNSYVTGEVRGPITFASTTLPEQLWYMFVSKFAPSGTLLWAKVLPKGTEFWHLRGGGRYAAIDRADNCYVTGRAYQTVTFGSTTLAPNEGVFVAKLDPSGNFVGALSGGGGPGVLVPRGIALDRSGNSYVAGVFTGTVTFGSRTLVGSLTKDTMFLWKVWLP